jgi:ribonuclease Z
VELLFLGTGSALSPPWRAWPATLVEARATALFGCGDGTAGRLGVAGANKVDFAAVTAFGVTELSGLLGLADVRRRHQGAPLIVYGPPPLAAIIRGLAGMSEAPLAELFDVRELEPGALLYERAGVRFSAFALDAGPSRPAFGYLIQEDTQPGRFDVAKAGRLGISGSDFGLLGAGQTVRGVRPRDVMGPPRPGRRLVFCGRGRPTPALEAALDGADVAVFAAPFMDERLELAQDAGYLTGWEAAELSSRTGVRSVVFQQLSFYAPARHQLAEAVRFHGHILAPDDGQSLTVPMPGAGLARLARPTGKRP